MFVLSTEDKTNDEIIGLYNSNKGGTLNSRQLQTSQWLYSNQSDW